MMPREATPYEVLGVSPSATPEEITRAFRQRSREHHPDLNGGKEEANERMRAIVAAYEALKTPEARAKTDEAARVAALPWQPAPVPPSRFAKPPQSTPRRDPPNPPPPPIDPYAGGLHHPYGERGRRR